MTASLLRLFPSPNDSTDLQGCYLDLYLHRLGDAAQPFVYANFLTSLDGRIAIEDAAGEAHLPKRLTTPNDFRLFLELECQADCLITHGGYLRALAEGRLGNILQIGAHELGRDLVEWRIRQGLPPQPAVVVASASLDFPMPPSLRNHGQQCFIATGEQADPQKVAYWQDQGFEVIRAGARNRVEGGVLTRELAKRGLCTLYLIAGPQMLETMVRDRMLARLFLTISHQLLGGAAFHTLIPGAELHGEGRMKLLSLYYDAHASSGAGQWFAQFEPLERQPRPINP